ncbi:XdhC/CoxI family protein [Ekhidna sp.]|uniref:XdhC family protein n=1 Tax=Ekhidna sp. TaxID=2608089 RepID=UPI003299D4AA
MRELKTIIEAYKQATAEGIKTVLATVVHVDGSSYRRPSARMLVDEHGITTGAISGGCLEGDALRKALHALVQNRNVLISYDTSDEADAVVGAQLGCEGIIQVLFEPMNAKDPMNPIQLLEQIIDSQNPYVMVTLFKLKDKRGEQSGCTLLLKDGAKTLGSIDDSSLQEAILKDAVTVFEEKRSLFRAYEEDQTTHNAFIEYFAPAVSLVIVGAGNDTQGLALMAETLGWNIYVVDGRPSHASESRFTSSCQIIVAKPEEALQNIPINEHTVFVLMTHNYHYDLSILNRILPYDQVPYIGILGPKKKFQRMVDELKEKGIEISQEQLDRIYAPIGLEIGAETPEEIAISVLSEINAVLNGTKGTFLRDKQGHIHTKENTQFDTLKI